MNTVINSNNESVGALSDWSKWLITINIFSATGCIIALKTAEALTPKIGAIFFAAIICFCLSLTCSSLFVLILARSGFKPGYDPKKYTWLATLQWILFVLGLACVLGWIGFLSKVF